MSGDRAPEGAGELADMVGRGSLLGMTSSNPYHGFRYSAEVIQHAVWRGEARSIAGGSPGLSHLPEDFQEDVVAPPCPFDFEADGAFFRSSSRTSASSAGWFSLSGG